MSLHIFQPEPSESSVFVLAKPKNMMILIPLKIIFEIQG